jgi:methanogenesis multiheme c-type cytochrome
MMEVRKIISLLLAIPLVFVVGYAAAQTNPTYNADLETSYHGALGHLLTPDVTDHESGMLEKWCALPDLNMAEDGFLVGKRPWVANCGTCHIGGAFGVLPVLDPNDPASPYAGNPATPNVNCLRCHTYASAYVADEPIVAACMACHGKEVAKRGFDQTSDVHIVGEGMLCQDCHVRMNDGTSDHQLAKGCTIDTTELTWWDSMSTAGSDCEGCHKVRTGDPIHKNTMLNQHAAKIACETCHTGERAGGLALVSSSWQNGAPSANAKRMSPWLPVLKWYDGGGPPTTWPADGHLPILNDPGMMKGWSRQFDAKIFPFNDIQVKWWIKDGSGPQPAYDDAISVVDVKAADGADGTTPDGVITEAEMQAYDGDGDTNPDYPNATLIDDKVCFNVSHSVQAKEDAFRCKDCHDKGDMGRYSDGWDNAKWLGLRYWLNGYPSRDPKDQLQPVSDPPTTIADLEMSYHGHLGHLSTADVTDHEGGMMEKWCALPNLSIADDGIEGPGSWTARCGGGSGGDCHIGGRFADKDLTLGTQTWERNPVSLTVDCARCHNKDGDQLTAPTNDKCMSCHAKEVAKRGFNQGKDVHMVGQGMLCQDCHFRFTADGSDHQLAKGTTLDTSMTQEWDTMNGGCSRDECHGATPPEHNNIVEGLVGILNQHLAKVACETCHTGLRTGGLALKTRSWQSGAMVNTKRMDDWVPFHKWYDGTGAPTTWPADGHLPILGAADMKDKPGAKIYPFNNISVTWWLKNSGNPEEPPYDDVIPNSVAAAATAFYGHTPNESEMQSYDGDGTLGADYPDAKLVTDTVSFNVSHSVEASFTCSDCHGWSNYVMEWTDLGFAEGDPAPEMSASISSLSTRRCRPKGTIDLNGSLFGDSLEDFGDPREKTKVKFLVPGVGQINLKVLAWTDNTITVEIPSKAKLQSKFGDLPVTGKVFIKNGKNKSNKKKLIIKKL